MASPLSPTFRIKQPLRHSRSSSLSRPLPAAPPPIPSVLMTCKNCRTCITSKDGMLPESSVPPTSRARKFSGFSGAASLFTKIQNVSYAKPSVQLMATGAHTLQEISCQSCQLSLGWRIVKAHEKSETWKEGHYLLELEALHVPSFAGNSPVHSPSF
ncbi:hypothetical protein DL96DRAFT_1460531 [Flagelloscypha sp. PMI_526]|nr:hypothetical protein DL96DRAFT_1460531 [Flagelloscypha sp. PMI_526]